MSRSIKVDKRLDILDIELETLRKRIKLLELQFKEMQNKNIIQSEVTHLDDEKKTKGKKKASK